MQTAKGTTPAWKRPFAIVRELPNREGWTDIDVLKLLRDTGMAQSMAEARRVLHEQNIVWVDRFDGPEEITIYDRMEKLAPFLYESRFFLVEPGVAILIGRSRDEAACHRITFI